MISILSEYMAILTLARTFQVLCIIAFATMQRKFFRCICVAIIRHSLNELLAQMIGQINGK